MPSSLSNLQKNALKARAQRLEPAVKLGQAGMSEAFLKGLNEALAVHELVKMKFAAFKEQKKELVPQIAELTRSEVIMRVGNVAVFFRSRPRTTEE